MLNGHGCRATWIVDVLFVAGRSSNLFSSSSSSSSILSSHTFLLVADSTWGPGYSAIPAEIQPPSSSSPAMEFTSSPNLQHPRVYIDSVSYVVGVRDLGTIFGCFFLWQAMPFFLCDKPLATLRPNTSSCPRFSAVIRVCAENEVTMEVFLHHD